MKTLRPSSVSVVLNYQCPSCQKQYPVEMDEAQLQGFSIVCCDRHMLQPVKNLNIKITFNKLVLVTAKDILKSAYHILKTYGYKQTEIDSFATQKAYDSTQTLVREFLAIK